MKNALESNLLLDGKKISIFYAEKGDYINISDITNKSYNKRTTFNHAFINFGDYFSKFINSKDSNTNINDNVFYLPSNKHLDLEFDKIKEYSNGKNILTYKFASDVLSSFKKIYSELNSVFPWFEDEFFIVPLKGGGFVINLFNFKHNRVFPVEAKRIPLKKYGHLGLGMNVDIEEHENFDKDLFNLHDKDITFLEVCIASGMTTIGFLLDLHHKGIKPHKVKILTAAASVQGIKVIQKVADDLDIDLVFYTAKLIENVTDFYDVSQDSIIYEDGSFVVKSPENAYRIVHGT